MATLVGQRLEVPGADHLRELWETQPGWRGVIGTVDHKEIGIRYMITAGVFFLLAGLQALLIRTQLIRPENTLVGPETYDELFTMHGTTMIFLFATPMLTGFGNYVVPLLIGARDMAFPRLNAFGYWIFLFSGLLLYASYLVGQVPNDGWFNYVPLSESAYTPGQNIDYWNLGLILLGFASTAGAINFIVTIFTMRAPGMSMNRVPLFIWNVLATAFSLVFAIPSLTTAALLLELERKAGFHFFDPAAGGNPLLWQHLFWIFGHPDVYIIFLPAVGIVSEIVPAFSRRPMVGYPFVAFATLATANIAFGVWAHHMFAVGLSMVSLSFFAIASLFVVVPSGVQMFAWLATLWSGRPVLKSPLLFVLGFIVTFTIGGLTGPMFAAAPFDWQTTDTYFIVAHFHYVLFGGAVFPIFGGLYYWLPKMTGRMLGERLASLNFWLVFIGFNLTFFPMHIVGLLGMPRRNYTFPAGLGWDGLNLLETIGSYILGLGVLAFVVNLAWSLRGGREAGPNPWGASTLEWATSSPPEAYNFRIIPTVRSRDPLWEQSEIFDPHNNVNGSRVTLGTSLLDARPKEVLPMPKESAWPLIVALGLSSLFVSVLLSAVWLFVLGLVVMSGGIVGWLWPTRPEGLAQT